MAQEALQKLEDQLNCSVCLDTYSDPKQLQCQHVFCRKCLVKLVVKDQQGQFTLTCPVCRHVTPVPATGAMSLQPAFQINNLLEVYDAIKKIQGIPSVAPPAETVVEGDLTESQTHSLPSRTYSGTAKKCFDHGEELKLYCNACSHLICFHCVIRGGDHADHDYELLSRAFERHEEEVGSMLEPLEKQLASVEEALAKIESCSAAVSERQSSIEASIQSMFGRLQEVLDARKAKLLGKVRGISQGKLEGLATQKAKIETMQAQLSSCLHFLKQSLETSNWAEVLVMKASIFKQVKELTSNFQSEKLEPNIDTDIQFSASEQLIAACRSYGEIFAHGSSNPAECHASGEGLERAIVGKISNALVRVVDFDGQPCLESVTSSLECELISELSGARVKGDVERRGQSEYEISYRPTIKGRHQLYVRLDNQHIRGSPFSVSAVLPVERLGEPMLCVGKVQRPWSVAVDRSKDMMVVTEFSGHRVSVFKPDGKQQRSFGCAGLGLGQFSGPTGVGIDSEGNILVADSYNHRIQKFTSEGVFVRAVGRRGTGPRHFDFPGGIAVDASDMVYVVDSNNHRIQILNSDLGFVSSFGSCGSYEGQFNFPYCIACDGNGNVYVSDSENHRVQVFTSDGEFVRAFCGSVGGSMERPFGIAVDAKDTVYVSECNNNRVSVFTSEGQFLTSFSSKGRGSGELRRPYGVAVDCSGVVYVCDSDNSRVQAF